jgi:Spy/CpxP family protein refolding chaperone
LLAVLLSGAALSAWAEGPAAGIAEPPAVWAAASLSGEQAAGLVVPSGMGRGRIAERNHHPGPSHVLDLADELGLDRSQIARLSDIERRLKADARDLAGDLLEQESVLAAGFAAATADAAQIGRISDTMAAIEAQLRTLHLTAHLETRAVLTPAQLARYEFLQGYTDSAEVPRS